MEANREETLGTSDGAEAARRPGRKPRSDRMSAVHDSHEEADRGQEIEREVSDDPELNDEERFAMFMDSQHQSVLPDLPPLPGYHVCWLTTNNARDSIQNRIRMGYQLVRIEELPGWEGVSLKTGDYTGVIGVNEMVAAKIPLALYNRYMRHVHHTLPLSEEEKLRNKTLQLKQAAEELGSMVEEGDGTASLVQKAKPMPDFDR